MLGPKPFVKGFRILKLCIMWREKLMDVDIRKTISVNIDVICHHNYLGLTGNKRERASG